MSDTPTRRFPDPDLHAQFRAAVASGDCGEVYGDWLRQEFTTQEDILRDDWDEDITARAGVYKFLAVIYEEMVWYNDHLQRVAAIVKERE